MNEMIQSMIPCFLSYLCYIIPFALFLIVLYFLFPIPKYIFRKLLHTAAFTSPVWICLKAPSWQTAVFILILFAVVVYPLLYAAERIQDFSSLFAEKRKGEIRSSLLLLFFSQAFLVFVSWGLFHLKWPCMTAALTWGAGDAAAAIVGKRFGRHIVSFPLADGKKTWEGTIANAMVSFFTAGITLLILSPLSFSQAVLFALVGAFVSSFVELITKGGNDTITVPLALTIVFLILK